ncbi:MAG: hypothetical protein WCX96_04540, partial [Bacilli bacterium]
MLEISKELLKIIEDNGYKAYIVGGFVRDIYLNRESIDVDICTNAKPMEIQRMFNNVKLDSKEYGSVSLRYKGIDFEITTFRKEIKYENNRNPVEIKYINSLDEDLKRRDFTINTLCMDKDGTIIDKFNGINDINNKLIRVVGDPNQKLSEDSLRILRAIRFATVLDFTLEEETEKAIMKYSSLIKKLSYTRIKYELNHMFISSNVKYGLDLLCKYNIDKLLGISNVKNITITNDMLGIWAQLNIDIFKWPFKKTERDLISKIREVLNMKLDIFTLYNYGLYIFQLASKIKGKNTKKLVNYYMSLPIKSKKNILIDIDNICKELNKEKGVWIKDLIEEIEKKIILKELNNDEKEIKK